MIKIIKADPARRRTIILRPGEEESIKNPTWEQIRLHLDMIDGENLDNLALSSPDTGEMIVCGGNEIDGCRMYGVSLFPSDGDGYIEYNLVNPKVKTRDEAFEEITTQGVGVHHNKELLVEYDYMVQAFKHFYETGQRSNKLLWE